MIGILLALKLVHGDSVPSNEPAGLAFGMATLGAGIAAALIALEQHPCFRDRTGCVVTLAGALAVALLAAGGLGIC